MRLHTITSVGMSVFVKAIKERSKENVEGNSFPSKSPQRELQTEDSVLSFLSLAVVFSRHFFPRI